MTGAIFKENKNLAIVPKILKEFKETEVYLVGGAARDLLLDETGNRIKEWHILVRGVLPHLLERFLRKQGKLDIAARDYGVYKFRPTGSRAKAIEIALPRRHFYLVKNSGQPGAADYLLPLVEDLSSRDFTVNSLAWDCRSHKLIDPWDGRTDLTNKVIRAIGSPAESLRNDYSRIPRALRFACALKGTIAAETWTVLQNAAPCLHDRQDSGERILPYEIIAREFLKAFLCQPLRAFDLYDAAGLFAQLVPELIVLKNCPVLALASNPRSLWEQTRAALAILNSPDFFKQFKAPASQLTVLGALFKYVDRSFFSQQAESANRLARNQNRQRTVSVTKAIVERLHLFHSAGERGVSSNDLLWLISRSQFFAGVNFARVKDSTLEKNFLDSRRPGKALLQFIYCDLKARSSVGEPFLNKFYTLEKRLKSLKHSPR